MAIEIQSLLSGSNVDNRIILTNSAIARTLSIGNDWNQIRIGMRATTTAIGNVSYNFLWVGMMADPSGSLANGPLGPNTSNFIGTYCNGNGVSPTWSQGLSGSKYWYQNSNYCLYVVKKNSTTINDAYYQTLGSPDSSFRISAMPDIRTALIFDVIKGSPNYSVHAVRPTGANGATYDFTKEHLIDAMGLPTLLTASDSLGSRAGHSSYYTSTGTGTIAASEVAGALTTVCVAWNRAIQPMIISDIFWAKIS